MKYVKYLVRKHYRRQRHRIKACTEKLTSVRAELVMNQDAGILWEEDEDRLALDSVLRELEYLLHSFKLCQDRLKTLERKTR